MVSHNNSIFIYNKKMSIYNNKMLIYNKEMSIYNNKMLIYNKEMSIYNKEISICKRTLNIYMKTIIILINFSLKNSILNLSPQKTWPKSTKNNPHQNSFNLDLFSIHKLIFKTLSIPKITSLNKSYSLPSKP